MANEEQDGQLEFNIEALTDGNSNTPSLSDLYGIPVFNNEIGRASLKLTANRDKKIDDLQRDVFFMKDNSSQEVEMIRENVFSTTVLAKNQDFVEERGESSTLYTVVSIVLFCFIVVIGVLYGKKKSKERKEYLETIDDFV